MLPDYSGEELRFYAWVPFQLSPIQQGIQVGHAAVDIVTKYLLDVPDFKNALDVALVREWAEKHKTFIILNGGPFGNLDEIRRLVMFSGLPWVKFHEDELSLKGLMTCVGVIVPESVFNAKPIENGAPYVWSAAMTTVPFYSRTYYEDSEETPLIELIKKSRLT